MPDGVIYRARSIITMDPACPRAEAVAVSDGRVLHTGTFAEVREWSGWGAGAVDDRFEAEVLVPGFIEGHAHNQSNGQLWQSAWVGAFERRAPDGSIVAACRSVDDVIARLREANQDEGEGAVRGRGYDPVFVDGRPLTRVDLDRVSVERPVVVVNASGHLAYVNSAALRVAAVEASCTVPGVVKDASGEPTGELHELAAMNLVLRHFLRDTAAQYRQAAWDGAQLARMAGCTTITDLAHPFSGAQLDAYRPVVEDDRYPVRVAVSPFAPQMLVRMTPEQAAAAVADARGSQTDRWRVGPVKFMLDGSIQGFTGQLNWPGYRESEDHGLWNVGEEDLRDQILAFHRAGLQVAIHTNGDAAIDAGLRVLEWVLERHPRPDHRHRLEHCQMASPAQFRKMKALGVCANLFVNHVFYWGDIHRQRTMGPDKARRLDAAGTALREGVPFSMHSDAPVTPVDPLFTIWCAVNRTTQSGYVLGPNERLGTADALHAMTLGSAYLLHLDHELGSIEVGKRADFTVLGGDPLEVLPAELRDIPVRATVLDGAVTGS